MTAKLKEKITEFISFVFFFHFVILLIMHEEFEII